MPIVAHVPPDVPAATSGHQSALVTAAVALLLSRKDAPPLAYIAGGLGTLIGADLTNLDKVRGLGAPAPERSTASFLPVSSRCCLRAFIRHALHIEPQPTCDMLRGSESATGVGVASGYPDCVQLDG